MAVKAISFYKDANSWKINGNPEPTNTYRALYSSNNTKVTVLNSDQGSRSLFKRTLITEIEKNAAGDLYADFAEFDAAVGSFFFDASDGGGIPSNLVFADAAARDSYFDPDNVGLLEIGLEIALEDDGSGNRTVQKWIGPDLPVSYSNSFWSPSFGGKALSHTFIADGDELPTAVLVANTPTKYQLPVTIRKINEFSITDIGGGIFALTYSGERNVCCNLNASTSLITSANNVVVKLMMYKNGAIAPSAIVKRKVGTGSDVGAMALNTTLDASKGDYFEVFVESDVATTITFLLTSIVISEI